MRDDASVSEFITCIRGVDRDLDRRYLRASVASILTSSHHGLENRSCLVLGTLIDLKFSLWRAARSTIAAKQRNRHSIWAFRRFISRSPWVE